MSDFPVVMLLHKSAVWTFNFTVVWCGNRHKKTRGDSIISFLSVQITSATTHRPQILHVDSRVRIFVVIAVVPFAGLWYLDNTATTTSTRNEWEETLGCQWDWLRPMKIDLLRFHVTRWIAWAPQYWSDSKLIDSLTSFSRVRKNQNVELINESEQWRSKHRDKFGRVLSCHAESWSSVKLVSLWKFNYFCCAYNADSFSASQALCVFFQLFISRSMFFFPTRFVRFQGRIRIKN